MHIGTTCVDEHEIFGAASVLTPGEMEVNAYRPSQDPRRASARIRDTAEGVLVALRRSSLNQAFIDVVHTAKSHNTSPLAWLTRQSASPRASLPSSLTTPASRLRERHWGTA